MTTLAPDYATIEKFQGAMGATKRLGVSDFARSKQWRGDLEEVGCFKVVDNDGTVGYMLAPDFAASLSKQIYELADQLEAEQIATIIDVRKDRTDFKTGKELRDGAIAYFNAHAEELRSILDGF